MAPRTSGTVTKALDILDLLVLEPNGLTITRMSDLTGINKSTVVRLCATLEGRGYLHRNKAGSYRVGAQIETLARVFRDQFDVEDIVRPILRSLREATEESAYFYVLDGDERILVYRENSFHPVRHVVEEGTRLPVTEGVVGKVMLAFSGTSGAEFESIRQNGYLDAEARKPQTASVCFPIIDADGRMVAAIGVSGPSARFRQTARKRAVILVKQAKRKLESSISIAMIGLISIRYR